MQFKPNFLIPASCEYNYNNFIIKFGLKVVKCKLKVQTQKLAAISLATSISVTDRRVINI